MARLRLSVLVCATAAGLSAGGCGPARPELGGPFVKVETIPPGKVLIYVYRPSMDVARAEVYDVRANGRLISGISDGGYFTCFVDPGEINFTVKRTMTTTGTASVTAGGGQTVYLKVYPARDIHTETCGLVQPKILAVGPETGEQEIAACRLMPQD